MAVDIQAVMARVLRREPIQLQRPPAMPPQVRQKLTRLIRRATGPSRPAQILTALRDSFSSVALLDAFAAYVDRPGKKTLEGWDDALQSHRDVSVEYEYIVRWPGALLAQIRRDLPRQVRTPRTVQSGVQVGKQRLEGWIYAAEAFVGGGLYDLALTMEGVYVGEICEYLPIAVETIKLNLHNTAVASNALTWTPKVPKGGLDLLTGGPPCQPFSQSRTLGGEGGGGGEIALGPADPRNMFPRVLEWVANAQPRVVCMENAAELASDTYREYVEWWYSQLDALGYEGTIWLLRAQDYGTPQMRARTFVLAWPKGASWGERLRTPPRATHGHPGSQDVSRGRLLPWIRAFDRLNSGCCGGFGLFTCINLGNVNGSCATCVNGRNYEPAPNQTDAEIRVNLNPTNIKTTIKGKHGAPRIRSFPPVPATVEDAWKALHIDEARLGRYLSPTIRGGARASGPPSGLIEPAGATAWGSVDVWDPASVRAYVEQLQRMSIRDAAKLQDVPQWYSFCGSPIAAYRQIGNGIPVNLGRAVARHIVEALRGGTPAFAPEPMAVRNHGLFEGLWPTEFVDPCAPYPGVIGWVESHSEQAFRTLVLDQEARLARPLVDLQGYEQMRDQRQQIEPSVEHWVDIGGGTPEYIHDFDSTGEPPPGFPDLASFDQWVQGQDLEIYNHYARLYKRSVWTDASGRVPIHPASPFYVGYGRDRLHPILHQYRRRVIGQKKGTRRDPVDLDAILTRLGL